MIYNCVRCGYETNHKGHFLNHLNRKKICKSILEDISIEDIKKHYELEFTPNNTQTTPKRHLNDTQTTPKQHPNDTLLISKLCTRVCKYCNKIFTRKSGLKKHLNICIVKKESESLIIKQEEEIQQMKLEIEELKTKSATTNNITNTINTNNNTNNTINTNNIINIKNLGDENINHLKNVDFAGMLKGIYNAVPKLIEKIHFDPNHPENQNIKYTNKKLPYLKVMKDNKWQLVNKKYELFDLIDNKCYLLKEKYYKILEKNKYNINEFQKSKIEEFMDKYNEDDKKVMLDLIERTELMLLNNS